MRKFLTILFLLASIVSFGQTITTSAIVADTTKLKAYNGTSVLIFVTDSAYNGFYYRCTSCTVDHNKVFQGVASRKWSRSVQPDVYEATSELNVWGSLTGDMTDQVDLADSLGDHRTDIDLKVKYSDTANILSAYRTALNARVKWTDTATLFTDYKTALNARVRWADTSSLFTDYKTALNARVRLADTSSLFTDYKTALNARIKYSDSSSILSAYQTALNARVRWTDTATLFSDYRTSDNARVKYSDTSTILGAYATALNARAPIASPALTGTPTAPTAVLGTNTTQVATTAFVRSELEDENLFYQGTVAFWVPLGGGSNTIHQMGLGAGVTGTSTAVTFSTSDIFSSHKQVSFLGAATTNTAAGVRDGTAKWLLGDAARKGGLRFRAIVGSGGTANPDMRGFYGMTASNGVIAGTTLVSDFVSCFGFGFDASHTNIQFVHNDGSGSATFVDMGASFPAKTAAVDMYDVRLSSEANSGIVKYYIRNRTSGAVASGSVSTNLPSGSTALTYHLWLSSGATATAADVRSAGVYIRTP